MSLKIRRILSHI